MCASMSQKQHGFRGQAGDGKLRFNFAANHHAQDVSMLKIGKKRHRKSTLRELQSGEARRFEWARVLEGSGLGVGGGGAASSGVLQRSGWVKALKN